MSSYASRLLMIKNGANWDGLLAYSLTHRHIEADYQRRDLMTGQEGAQGDNIHNLNAGLDFGVEAGSGGAAGTAPDYGAVLQACGMKETVAAGVSVSYSPQPVGEAQGEALFQMRNGVSSQQVDYARGSLNFSAEAGRKPMFTFKFLGSHADAEAIVVGDDPDFSGWDVALECSPANMSAFTLGGTELCVNSFSFTDGRTPTRGKFMNCDETNNLRRAITGRMVVEWPATATKDLLDAAKTGVTDTLIWQLGTVAGSIIRVAAPKVQIKYGGEQDIDGVLGIVLDLVFQTDQGADELAITFS